MKPAQRRFVAVFLAPALLLFTALVAVPGLQALAYSLHRWNGLTPPEWVGLDNFRALLAEGNVFLTALWHNLILLVGAGGLTLALSLAFAALLSRRVRGAAVYRVAFFFPNTIALVAVALLWILLYSATSFGLFNALLRAVGADALGIDLPYPFLDSRNLIVALIPMVAWAATGFYMVLFLAAMTSVPEEYYEAARLEGASGWQQFRHITLPLIRDVIAVGVVFLCISSLKFFDPIWVMENQRPNRQSHVLATLLYQKAFTEYDIGHAAAIAVLLFVLVFAATLLSLRLMRRERMEY
jgi:ABC-type sugar transport system permease subunit